MDDTPDTGPKPSEDLKEVLREIPEVKPAIITGKTSPQAIVSIGVERIGAERYRQIVEEHWTPRSDDTQTAGQLSMAAACYAAGTVDLYVGQLRKGTWLTRRALMSPVSFWPWHATADKRKKHSRLKQLAIAGALIAAEIDRLERRVAGTPTPSSDVPQRKPHDSTRPICQWFGFNREALGKLVRAAWIEWANTQPDPKHYWLVPWEELASADQEADRHIGETVARACLKPDRIVVEMERLKDENDQLRARVESLRTEAVVNSETAAKLDEELMRLKVSLDNEIDARPKAETCHEAADRIAMEFTETPPPIGGMRAWLRGKLVAWQNGEVERLKAQLNADRTALTALRQNVDFGMREHEAWEFLRSHPWLRLSTMCGVWYVTGRACFSEGEHRDPAEAVLAARDKKPREQPAVTNQKDDIELIRNQLHHVTCEAQKKIDELFVTNSRLRKALADANEHAGIQERAATYWWNEWNCLKHGKPAPSTVSATAEYQRELEQLKADLLSARRGVADAAREHLAWEALRSRSVKLALKEDQLFYGYLPPGRKDQLCGPFANPVDAVLAAVATLKKTIDGVPAIFGMHVFDIDGHELQVFRDGWCYPLNEHGKVDEDAEACIQAVKSYSTLEAAENARNHDGGMSIATDEAVQMLAAGWTTRYLVATDDIEWRSPNGISEGGWRSKSLDSPPRGAVMTARKLGQIRERPRQ